MASEVGKAEEKVYLITNLKRVKPGDSGGISFKGEMAAVIGSILTAMLSTLLGVIGVSEVLYVVLAAFAGVHVDSCLVQLLKKKGI